MNLKDYNKAMFESITKDWDKPVKSMERVERSDAQKFNQLRLAIDELFLNGDRSDSICKLVKIADRLFWDKDLKGVE